MKHTNSYIYHFNVIELNFKSISKNHKDTYPYLDVYMGLLEFLNVSGLKAVLVKLVILNSTVFLPQI